MADTRRGRHRAAARYNPLAELSTVARSSGDRSVKTVAALAAAGGLVAAFALPAHAAPVHRTSTTAPGAERSTTTTAPPASALAPAVVAPETTAPVAVETVGVVGVRAVAKPKPKPRPKPRPAPEPKAHPVAVTVQSRTSTASGTTSRASGTTSRPGRTRSTGPVSRSHTRSTPVQPKPVQSSSRVVTIARSLLGIPYVYGGSTPSGFDCSGFTKYVFGKAGISLPRTASAQQRAATRVSHPRPGDLVFFGSPAYHVGIYTGNGKMIDSPRRGKSTSERAVFSGVSGYGRF